MDIKRPGEEEDGPLGSPPNRVRPKTPLASPTIRPTSKSPQQEFRLLPERTTPVRMSSPSGLQKRKMGPMVDHDTDVHDIDVEEVKSKFPRKAGHFDERKTEHRQVCIASSTLYRMPKVQQLLYILTSVWVLRTPNAGQNMPF